MCQEEILNFLKQRPDGEFTRRQMEIENGKVSGAYIEPLGKLRRWGDVNWREGTGARKTPYLYWHKPEEDGEGNVMVSPLLLTKSRQSPYSK